MMPARMYDLTAMKAPVEQPVLCRDLVSAQDFSPEETKSMFELTHIIKHRPADFRGALAGKQLVLFFEKASLRTRLTFEAGMASLGGTSLLALRVHARLKALTGTDLPALELFKFPTVRTLAGRLAGARRVALPASAPAAAATTA